MVGGRGCRWDRLSRNHRFWSRLSRVCSRKKSRPSRTASPSPCASRRTHARDGFIRKHSFSRYIDDRYSWVRRVEGSSFATRASRRSLEEGDEPRRRAFTRPRASARRLPPPSPRSPCRDDPRRTSRDRLQPFRPGPHHRRRDHAPGRPEGRVPTRLRQGRRPPGRARGEARERRGVLQDPRRELPHGVQEALLRRAPPRTPPGHEAPHRREGTTGRRRERRVREDRSFTGSVSEDQKKPAGFSIRVASKKTSRRSRVADDSPPHLPSSFPSPISSV